MTTLPPPTPPAEHRYFDASKRLRPRTYTVAVFLVLAVLTVEVTMIISVFVLRSLVIPVATNPQALIGKNAAPSPATNLVTVPHLITSPHLTSVDGAPSSDLPMLSAQVDLPALLSSTVSDRLQQIGDLNVEAENALHLNNEQQAEVTLLKAEDLDPRNPTTLKNLALTYDAMNDPVRSKIFWQRATDLGPGVGSVYALAQDHLALLNSSSSSDPLHQPSGLPRYVYLQNVQKSPVETVSGTPQFHLRAVLGRKDVSLPFSQKLLQPFVIFYVKKSTGELQPDLHQRKGSFENTFLFWNKSRQEPFDVDYLMPDAEANPAAGTYYGFIIGIYYDKILQDQRAEPSDLVNREPLPIAIE